MPQQYNVTLKEGATDADLAATKKQAIDQGGKIVNEFEIIKAFTVEFPDGHTHTLATNDKMDVETDGKVSTQGQ